jgi:hypothetical protein
LDGIDLLIAFVLTCVHQRVRLAYELEVGAGRDKRDDVLEDGSNIRDQSALVQISVGMQVRFYIGSVQDSAMLRRKCGELMVVVRSEAFTFLLSFPRL